MFGENRKLFTRGRLSREAVFQTQSGVKTIRGVFDESFYDAQAGENRLDASSPRFTCWISEIEGIEEETLVTIGGRLYSVVRPEPDRGTGLVVLILTPETPEEEEEPENEDEE